MTGVGLAIAKQTIFLMGISFMLGSLFTVFVLLILEMLRSSREARENLWREQQLEDAPSYNEETQPDA